MIWNQGSQMARAQGWLSVLTLVAFSQAGCAARAGDDGEGTLAESRTELVAPEEDPNASPPRIDGYCYLQHPAAWANGRNICRETPFPSLPQYEYFVPGESVLLITDPKFPGDMEGWAMATCHYRANYPNYPYLQIDGECHRTPAPPPYIPPTHPPEEP